LAYCAALHLGWWPSSLAFLITPCPVDTRENPFLASLFLDIYYACTVFSTLMQFFLYVSVCFDPHSLKRVGCNKYIGLIIHEGTFSVEGLFDKLSTLCYPYLGTKGHYQQSTQKRRSNSMREASPQTG
jgi:hypothetical protein